jgi:hypothetical protein
MVTLTMPSSVLPDVGAAVPVGVTSFFASASGEEQAINETSAAAAMARAHTNAMRFFIADLLVRVFLCGRDKTPRVTVVRGVMILGALTEERREKREES